MSELREARKGIYQVTHRTTGEKRLTVASSAPHACSNFQWMVSDCYVTLYTTREGKYRNELRFDLVAVPCETCPYQYAECRKPESADCSVRNDVPDLHKWFQKVTLAHLCDFVGEDIDKSHHSLRHKLIPFEEAVKELDAQP